MNKTKLVAKMIMALGAFFFASGWVAWLAYQYRPWILWIDGIWLFIMGVWIHK